MSTVSTVSGLTLPAQGDILNAEAALGQFVNSADGIAIPRFATTTARDAAFVAGATEGQLCVVFTPAARLQRYDGTTWRYFENEEVYRKTANQVVNNSVTLVNATDLVGAVEANASYFYECWLIAQNANAAANFLFQAVGPAGSTFTKQITAVTGSSTSNIAKVQLSSGSAAGAASAGCPSAVAGSIMVQGILTTVGTAGTFQVQFAQATATAANTTLIANSVLSLKRFA